MFDPKLDDFFKNEDLTMFGVIWSLVWRFYVLVLGVCLAAGLLVELFS